MDTERGNAMLKNYYPGRHLRPRYEVFSDFNLSLSCLVNLVTWLLRLYSLLKMFPTFHGEKNVGKLFHNREDHHPF